ncbi:MAG TPA: class I SAM-dependent methyltransferase [Oscillatoriaceae cyanobacterium M33_DOE_052]|uniref:Class I SAM-dependent methyltransferase n=1 Tax=Planktothricoides sp. SpSt-374 TaxID=2282167 RepID=A0A7C3VDZ7_9CYAN|nr:class I SAM-dependent methyltransferase [Oscillatoriaceae cyanobacterium M33_DOE_052]
MNTSSSQYQYAYFNSQAKHHHAYIISPLLAMLAEARKNLPEKPRLLDLGCGNGSLTHVIAQQGYEVVGVEPSEQGVTIAQKTFPDYRLIHASVYDLPDAELGGKFDIVISVEVIEHLIYPRELLKAARHCLKPNGTLIITTPYHGYLKNLALALSGKMDRHFQPCKDGGHIKFFSANTLTELFKSEGFTGMQLQFAGRFPYLWKSMLCAGTIAD